MRSRRLNGHRVGGYQPDIAHEDWITGIMYEEAGRGVLARRGEKVVIDSDGQRQAERFADENELGEHIRPRGEWNDYHVIAKGNRIVTKINGQTMHEVIDDATQARASGLIAFQLHAGPPMTIRFRNIRLKEDATPSSPTSSNPTKKVVLIAGSPSHGEMHWSVNPFWTAEFKEFPNHPALVLGLRQLPHGGAQRDRLDGRA